MNTQPLKKPSDSVTKSPNLHDSRCSQYRKTHSRSSSDLHQTSLVSTLSTPFSPSPHLDAVLVVVQHTTSNGCPATSTEVLSVSKIDTPLEGKYQIIFSTTQTFREREVSDISLYHLISICIFYIYVLYVSSSLQPTTEFAPWVLHSALAEWPRRDGPQRLDPESPSVAMGYPNSWMVFVRENPKVKWMMTLGTPISGNLQMMHPSTCQACTMTVCHRNYQLLGIAQVCSLHLQHRSCKDHHRNSSRAMCNQLTAA